MNLARYGLRLLQPKTITMAFSITHHIQKEISKCNPQIIHFSYDSAVNYLEHFYPHLFPHFFFFQNLTQNPNTFSKT